METKNCPKCDGRMIREYLDGPGGTVYLAWICVKCGHEEPDQQRTPGGGGER